MRDASSPGPVLDRFRRCRYIAGPRFLLFFKGFFMSVGCPALLLCAPGSGHGKTSVTAALARLHRRLGRRVLCLKLGPDFIDPTILQRASGAPVYNLDLWMMGAAHCRALLFAAAQRADVILVEAAMGLFDGAPSAADISTTFALPIVPVIDAGGVAQTFAALVHGLTTFRSGLQVSGVVANRVGSARHEQLLRAELPPTLPLSCVARCDDALIPERHLGLQLGAEIADLDARLDRLADLLTDTPLAQLPPPVMFDAPSNVSEEMPLLRDWRVAIARDRAFAFLYPANIEWLQRMGAQVSFFSPLDDGELPPADAVYLPGGYPELHAQALAENTAMRDALRAHVAAQKPLLAECGGLLYASEALRDFDDRTHAMLGVLPGTATMGRRLVRLGPQQLADTPLRGHTFHYSKFETTLAPVASAHSPDGRTGEAVYRHGAVTASYVHWYFSSHGAQIAAWLRGD